jgi:hypothetical protein
LIIACNGIDSVACISIIVGVIENLNLKVIVMDGNPIGEQGIIIIINIFFSSNVIIIIINTIKVQEH